MRETYTRAISRPLARLSANMLALRYYENLGTLSFPASGLFIMKQSKLELEVNQ